MKALVLQHIACEPPRVYEDVLLERRATIHRAELDEGEPLSEMAQQWGQVPVWRMFERWLAAAERR